nr:copia protein [Tanacetum cinerariifolium]
MKVEESLNVIFDETLPPPKTSPLEDDDLFKKEAIEVNKKRPLGNDLEDKPDIMFSVYLCARFQEDPKTTHLEVVKCIIQYVKGTTYLGLWYPKGSDIETIVYADSDHAGDYVDRKSTSGICMFMGCCLTSWFLKKQTALAISTTKAKYVSTGKAYQQALWMKQDLIDYDIMLDDIPIMCDNKGAINLSNPQLELQEKGVIDSGCSRRMTGNMSYLFDYEEIDGGYVAFGGDPKGDKAILSGADNRPLMLEKDMYDSWKSRMELYMLNRADNRPPILEKDMYDSWKSRMELYMLNRPNGRMILESVEHGPLIWPTVEVKGVTRLKKYSELSAAEAIQADSDVKATNIILQGLPPE